MADAPRNENSVHHTERVPPQAVPRAQRVLAVLTHPTRVRHEHRRPDHLRENRQQEGYKAGKPCQSLMQRAVRGRDASAENAL